MLDLALGLGPFGGGTLLTLGLGPAGYSSAPPDPPTLSAIRIVMVVSILTGNTVVEKVTFE